MVLTEPRNPINVRKRAVGTFASRAQTPTMNLALLMIRKNRLLSGGYLCVGRSGGLVVGLTGPAAATRIDVVVLGTWEEGDIVSFLGSVAGGRI